PSMLNYSIHIDKESMFNTPPVFPVFVSMLTLQWIKDNGGLEAMAARNEEKAQLLYAEIDRNSLFNGHSVPEDRSLMNVCFRATSEEVENEFLAICKKEGLDGLKGHRSVGGLRASIYNALEKEAVEKLVELMK